MGELIVARCNASHHRDNRRARGALSFGASGRVKGVVQARQRGSAATRRGSSPRESGMSAPGRRLTFDAPRRATPLQLSVLTARRRRRESVAPGARRKTCAGSGEAQHARLQRRACSMGNLHDFQYFHGHWRAFVHARGDRGRGTLVDPCRACQDAAWWHHDRAGLRSGTGSARCCSPVCSCPSRAVRPTIGRR